MFYTDVNVRSDGFLRSKDLGRGRGIWYWEGGRPHLGSLDFASVSLYFHCHVFGKGGGAFRKHLGPNISFLFFSFLFLS